MEVIRDLQWTCFIKGFVNHFNLCSVLISIGNKWLREIQNDCKKRNFFILFYYVYFSHDVSCVVHIRVIVNIVLEFFFKRSLLYNGFFIIFITFIDFCLFKLLKFIHINFLLLDLFRHPFKPYFSIINLIISIWIYYKQIFINYNEFWDGNTS